MQNYPYNGYRYPNSYRNARNNDQRFFPLLPFVAGLAVGPLLFGGGGFGNRPPYCAGPYCGPNYGPNFGPNYGPNYGPQYGPGFGPQFGPGYGPQFGPSFGPQFGPNF
ncbi:hypothetical protein AZF04_06385 [Alkalihalobacillus trypoxylicola]|uniref:Uncharacterized protein n=1 Tax=Alkalihalobacillus trypoxylicola TaxID=519424 RepID=A0A162EG03_9BACI|nr:hypothetical protein AZF04_06385 [Alkalihalobacillus trypoxylicola]